MVNDLDFIYHVSHDLRAPLTHLEGYLLFLQEKLLPAADEEVVELMSKIKKSAQMLSKMLDALTLISRIQNQPLHLEKIPLQEVVEAVWNELETPDAALSYDQLPIVLCDRALIFLLVKHLFENSLKFSRINTKPLLHLRVQEASADHWHFTLSDNGIGIPQHQREKALTLFYQCVKDKGGVGAGLSVADLIVKKHGGKLWLEQEKEQGLDVHFII